MYDDGSTEQFHLYAVEPPYTNERWTYEWSSDRQWLYVHQGYSDYQLNGQHIRSVTVQ